MKQHRPLSPRQEALHERSLYGAMLTLQNVDEVRAFFRDLCTPAELQAHRRPLGGRGTARNAACPIARSSA